MGSNAGCGRGSLPPDETFRLLLDEGFPSPSFDPAVLDPALEVVALRDFDKSLVGKGTPDWYLYLRADEADFDALVTGDLHQSGQAEEMWALTRTRLSVVTWRQPEYDSVVAWGQVIAYLPEIRRMIREHGDSIVYLPRARLTMKQFGKASGHLGVIASEEGRSVADVLRQAEQAVREGLADRGQLERFQDALVTVGKNRPR